MNYNFDIYEVKKQFLEFMRSLDAYPVNEDDLIFDGQTHRYTIEGDKRSSKNGAYRVYLDGIPAGFVQDWKKNTKENWSFDTKGYSKEQIDYFNSEEFRKESERRREQRQKELRVKQVHASEMARVMFEQFGSPPAKFAYLKNKKVLPHDLRFNSVSKSLAVPLRNIDGRFLTLQWIDENGDKRFFPDAPSVGAFWSINLDKASASVPILLGEGWATMAKVHELTGLPCVAAMTCGNLEDVAKSIHEKYSKVKIIVTADNDKETEERRGYNPGIQAAKKVVEAKLAVEVLAPPFIDSHSGSDWDDYAINFGDDAAKVSLEEEIKWACLSKTEREKILKRKEVLGLISYLDPSIDIPPQEFIGGMYPRKFVSAVVAPSGTGKTMFMQKSVSDLSVGGTIFDGFAEDEPPRKCLIFAGEAGYELLLRRGAQTKWPVNPANIPVVDQYKYEIDGHSLMLDTDEGWTNINWIIEDVKPDIVFWDTLQSFHDKDENKAVDMKPILKRITESARNNDYAAVLVHHSRKRTAKERTASLSQDDVIGSSIFNRLVALIVGIEPINNEMNDTGEKAPLLVRPLKNWFSTFMPFTFSISEDTNGRTVIKTDLAPEVAGTNSKIAVWNYLRAHFTPDVWFSYGDIAVEEITPSVSPRQLRRVLTYLSNNKKIKRRGENKSTEYSVIGFYDTQE